MPQPEPADAEPIDQTLTPHASRLTPGERLWTPWRMRYVGGGTGEDGCVFCNRLAADDDVASLIVHRADRVFVILNLFPYNTAHLMLVPNAHVASPEDTPAETLAELATMLQPTLRALRRTLGCHGFNVGFNVGAVAGAGVAAHLHQHVVPRWTGDANFMPILAATMVLPELIPVTYAKVRAELERELTTNTVSVVTLTPDLSRLLIDRSTGRLPSAAVDRLESVWRAALRVIGEVPGGVEIAGWAGQARASLGGPLALTLLCREPVSAVPVAERFHWVEVARVDEVVSSPPDRVVVRQALTNLAPVLGPA